MPFAFLSSWLRPRSHRSRKSSSFPRDGRRAHCRRVPLLLEALEPRLPPGDLSGELGLSPLSGLMDPALPGSSGPADEPALVAEATQPLEMTSEPMAFGLLDAAGNGSSAAVEAGPAPDGAADEPPLGIDDTSVSGSWSLIDTSLSDPLPDAAPADEPADTGSVPPTGTGIGNPFAGGGNADTSGGGTVTTRSTSDNVAAPGPVGPPPSDADPLIGLTGVAGVNVPPVTPIDLPPGPTEGPTPPGATPPGVPPPAGGLGVRLVVPEVTNSPRPGVTVIVSAAPDVPPDTAVTRIVIDIDLNNDGVFQGEEELSFATAFFYHAPGEFVLRLDRGLEEGIYRVQARVTDSNEAQWGSTVVTMRVDLHAGFIGSDALRRLYADYVRVTTGAPHPLWSFPYWGGDGYQLSEQYGAKILASTYSPQELSWELFLERFHDGFVYDNQNRVIVNVRTMRAADLGEMQTDLRELGMTVVTVSPDHNQITGYLPIGQIANVIALPGFASITPVFPRKTRLGAFTSEGDAAIRADTFRRSTGASGAGVTVGVISDSANRIGGGIAASQASGDLTSNVLVVLDGNDPTDTDEGRAMMEIVQDVAPDSRVLFHSAGSTPVVFANGVDVLGNIGANVIVDDIAFANQPFFNDGLVALAIDRQTATNGVTYVSAAGNDSNIAYDSAYREVRRTLFGVPLNVHDFGGGDVLQNFTLPVGQEIRLSFQWDDAFLEGGSPLLNYQVTTDLDVLITNAAGTVIFDAFIDFNDITDEAFEFINFTNDGTFNTTQFAILINRFSGPPPAQIRWVDFGSSVNPMAQFQGGPTIYGAPAAKTAIAVGAVDWSTPQSPEPFTSLGGPLPYFFDANGNRLATPEVRNKPDVAGPDNVMTSFFPAPPPGNLFTGTSAAAPHVAGAVALLLEQAQGATPAQIKQHLMATALDGGAPGFDPLLGAGLIQLTPLILPPLSFPDDRFERNDTSDQATNQGTIADTVSLGDLTIAHHPDGFPDYDWFRWTAGFAGTFKVTLNKTAGLGDLEVYLFTLDDNTLVLLDSSAAPGVNPRLVEASVTAGQVLLVEVKGRNSALGVIDQGAYGLVVTLI